MGRRPASAWSDGNALVSNNIPETLLVKRCTIVQQQGMITVTVSEEKL